MRDRVHGRARAASEALLQVAEEPPDAARGGSWSTRYPPACARPRRPRPAGPPRWRRRDPRRCPAGRAAWPGGPSRTGLFSMCAAISRTPASWQAPPVSTMRAPIARVRPRTVQPVVHQVEDFLDARADDVHHHAARHLGDLVLLLADQRHRQQLPLVVGEGLRVAVQRLQPLGVRDRGGQPARRDRLVTCKPPIGSCAVCSRWPSANTAMPVVPPPMSMHGGAESRVRRPPAWPGRRPSAPTPPRRCRGRSARCRRRASATPWLPRRRCAAAPSAWCRYRPRGSTTSSVLSTRTSAAGRG